MSERTMTNYRYLFTIWLTGVIIMLALSITPLVASAEQDDDSSDSTEISESYSGVASDAVQADNPSLWNRFLSYIGLGGSKPEAPASSQESKSAETEVKKDTPVPETKVLQEQPEQETKKTADTEVNKDVAAPETKVLREKPVQASTVEAPSSSYWERFLSTIGLYDDTPAHPPEELKGTSSDLFGQDYLIGPGDQLGITVWRDDMLTRTVLVLPDGKIQYPLIGELMVGGKTVIEVKKELMEKLAAFVVDADISVEIKQSTSLFIYIIGRVNAPGRQMLVADTTVMQALAMAGGLNPFAQEDDIKIFRHEKDKTLVYKFRYSHVSVGKHLGDNIVLKRGDVLMVP